MKKARKDKLTANQKKKSWKTYLAEFWDFIWNNDSFASWITCILLAFVIIRFVFYPLLGLVIGTQMPIVAVISGSMEHHGADWTQNPAYCSLGYCLQEELYLDKGITPAKFSEFPFRKGFNTGDLMIITGKKPEKIEVGDVIVFEVGKNYPIIHRVVDIKKDANNNLVFETKGDNNPASIVNTVLDEKNVTADRVQGVATVRIPYLGYIKIAATKALFTVRDLFINVKAQ
jgi:signal peptidase I